MQQIDAGVVHTLVQPEPNSHKGNNGRVLVIAGSDKFHGALLMCVKTASKIVDMVSVYTTPSNRGLIDGLKSEMAAFVAVRDEDLEKAIQAADAIIIGPGMETTDEVGEEKAEETRSFVHDLLEKHQDKKWVVDATALWHVDTNCLHKNCLLTPHSREFQNVFGLEPTAENTKKAAQTFGGVVVLKGASDYVSDGETLFENTTGNVGMTKGGTGDVLAGLIGGLLATNDLCAAAKAGVYLNGVAGDQLYDRVGTFYNAEDLLEEVGKVWKAYVS